MVYPVAACRNLNFGAPIVGPSSLLTNLAAYYALENANDSHTGGYNLTNNNTVTFVAGKLNNAASFVGASTQSLSSTNSVFDLADTPFGFSFWLKGTATDVAVCGKAEAGVDNKSWDWYVNGSGQIVAYYRNAANTSWYAVTGGTVADDAWHHVVIQSTTTNLSVIVDDGTPATGSCDGGRNAGQFRIGAYIASVGEYWTGLIDEFALRKGSVFSAEEITALNGGGTPPAYPFEGILPT